MVVVVAVVVLVRVVFVVGALVFGGRQPGAGGSIESLGRAHQAPSRQAAGANNYSWL
jgi:hypothetical protein